MRKASGDLHGRANRKSNPCGDASLSRLAEVAMRRQLANDGADEWTDDDARETEEEAGKRAERGARHGARAGSEAFGPERDRDEVDSVARQER